MDGTYRLNEKPKLSNDTDNGKDILRFCYVESQSVHGWLLWEHSLLEINQEQTTSLPFQSPFYPVNTNPKLEEAEKCVISHLYN